MPHVVIRVEWQIKHEYIIHVLHTMAYPHTRHLYCNILLWVLSSTLFITLARSVSVSEKRFIVSWTVVIGDIDLMTCICGVRLLGENGHCQIIYHDRNIYDFHNILWQWSDTGINMYLFIYSCHNWSSLFIEHYFSNQADSDLTMAP